MRYIVYFILLLFISLSPRHGYGQGKEPIIMAMMGLSHGHSSWIFNREDLGDLKISGIYEPDVELAKQFQERYGLEEKIFYTDPEKMLDEVKPKAVLAFGSIQEHLQVVEWAAPRGIHVMVEKPLSAFLDQAIRMKELAEEHQIFLLTNYETSWYPSTEKTRQLLLDEESFGPIRKAVFHHGHRGPKEIGVGPEFLEWLIDPVKNGGGALIDFGCYGANIMTYLMKGEKPLSVTAITQTYKPDVYSQVDDEATIILQYPEAQAILQASWNWPFDRKDMEVYGSKGYVISKDRSNMSWRKEGDKSKTAFEAEASALGVYTDPFTYFVDVINDKATIEPFSWYSLENNMIVVEILDAARESARLGETVFLQP
ncbi:Gfo/Idh/MocA family protein [Pararhodonellum marinum]|uniref:Gfo/Idh/MocA family protein n=1 Tax=Pararhodonellum marinum TaxID=2755358 RepID=UPI001890934E|nr:Gfo/Idh/MocA family oxidoreductase [Pararhodonellum marinum]